MTSRLPVNMPTAIGTSETGTKQLITAKAQMNSTLWGHNSMFRHGASWLKMTDAMRILWPHRPQPLSRFWSISWECSAVKGINMRWQSCLGETKPSWAVANFGSGFLQQPNQTKSWSSSHKSMTQDTPQWSILSQPHRAMDGYSSLSSTCSSTWATSVFLPKPRLSNQHDILLIYCMLHDMIDINTILSNIWYVCVCAHHSTPICTITRYH